MAVTIELGKVTDWLTAFGTIGAVWAALHLANRDNTVHLQGFATIGLIVGGPNPPPSIEAAPRYLWINVTNAGRRAAYVTNIGWRSGVLRQWLPWFGYRHFVQSYLPQSGPQLPLKLEDGQAAQWWLPLDEWLRNNAASMTKTPARFHMRTTYLQVFTSTGKPLTVKMSKALRDKMIEFATTATEQTATPGNP